MSLQMLTQLSDLQNFGTIRISSFSWSFWYHLYLAYVTGDVQGLYSCSRAHLVTKERHITSIIADPYCHVTKR